MPSITMQMQKIRDTAQSSKNKRRVRPKYKKKWPTTQERTKLLKVAATLMKSDGLFTSSCRSLLRLTLIWI